MKQTIDFALLRSLDGAERQYVMDTVREVLASDAFSATPARARATAEAAIAGIATLRGNDGPVVLKRKGQGQRELADELEEMASQLRRDADAWDAEMDAIASPIRSETSTLRGNAGADSSPSLEARSQLPKLGEKQDAGASNE